MSDEATQREVVRDERGRWVVPPKSPGRPKGPSQAEMMRELIEPHRRRLVARGLQLMRSKDEFAAAQGLPILLERLAPVPRQEAEKVHVPGMAEAVTFEAKCQCVIAAVAAGEISAEAGERLLRLIDVYRKAVHTDTIVTRLDAQAQEIARLRARLPAQECDLA